MLAVKRANGLPTWRARAAASDLGVSLRTLWRWLGQAERDEGLVRRRRGRYEVDQDALVELAYHRGNVAAVRRSGIAAGEHVPSAPTLRAAYARALSPGRWAGIKAGERERRDYDTYLPQRKACHRNDFWESDHTQLAVHVGLPDGRVVMPWLTLFVDHGCRAILGWALAVTPSQESVLGALRAAIDMEAPNGPMGGVPRAIRFDRGKEFLANAVRLAAASLAIDARALPAYSPHLKGAVERANESIEQLFLATLPGFVHGPRGKDGRLVEDGPLLSLEGLAELFAAFVTSYNTERPHQGLKGRTPWQCWQDDPTPLAVVPPRHLHHLLLARAERVVTKHGVRLDGRVYNCAELCGWVGEHVEVRYLPHHHHQVEVFHDDEHLATAVLVDELAQDDVARLLAHRAADARWLAQTQRAAAKARRVRFAALTAPGPLSEATVPTRLAAAGAGPYHDDLAMARAASDSLVAHRPVPAHMLRRGRGRRHGERALPGPGRGGGGGHRGAAGRS